MKDTVKCDHLGANTQFCGARHEKRPREHTVRKIFLTKSASAFVKHRRPEAGGGRPETAGRRPGSGFIGVSKKIHYRNDV